MTRYFSPEVEEDLYEAFVNVVGKGMAASHRMLSHANEDGVDNLFFVVMTGAVWEHIVKPSLDRELDEEIG